ncbi:MAG: hypothetical protein BWK80_50790 [Desulfobacteraceae bacterium IS3]|nr:MAG: hypothetical protein BWK80_50790 [Desulfobacteraceae bacterium IS3]
MCQEKLKKQLLYRFFCKMNRIKQHFAVIVIAMMIWEAAGCQRCGYAAAEIVIDAGGTDTGACGSEGICEKNILLNLARRLESELFQKGYGVKLTRTGDVSPDIYDRSGCPNRRRADIFVSLHVGGSFTHLPGAVTIFYFDRKTESVSEHAGFDNKSREMMLWDDLWYPHQSESRRLAKMMQECLSGQIKSAEIRIRGAPILIAEGADMPAVLIEIGSVSNPAQRKALQSRQGLSDIAKGIGKGIEAFFLQKK